MPVNTVMTVNTAKTAMTVKTANTAKASERSTHMRIDELVTGWQAIPPDALDLAETHLQHDEDTK